MSASVIFLEWKYIVISLICISYQKTVTFPLLRHVLLSQDRLM